MTTIIQVRDIFDIAQLEFEYSGEEFFTHRKYDSAPSNFLTLKYYIKYYQERREGRRGGQSLEGGDGGGSVF